MLAVEYHGQTSPRLQAEQRSAPHVHSADSFLVFAEPLVSLTFSSLALAMIANLIISQDVITYLLGAEMFVAISPQ